MKRNIIISINPEHVANIINGTKKFEYRTKAAKCDIGKIIIYETTPVKKVVAEAEIIDVLMMSPDELWAETKDASGITKQYYDSYFKNRNVAYAYKLGAIKVYKRPRGLDEFGLRFAPQSFVYVR